MHWRMNVYHRLLYTHCATFYSRGNMIIIILLYIALVSLINFKSALEKVCLKVILKVILYESPVILYEFAKMHISCGSF